MSHDSTYLSARDVAARLGLCEMTVRRMATRQELACVRLGCGRGLMRFTDRHVNEYLARREQPAAAQAQAA
jgi:excisionase family DNA binding protein